MENYIFFLINDKCFFMFANLKSIKNLKTHKKYKAEFQA